MNRLVFVALATTVLAGIPASTVGGGAKTPTTFVVPTGDAFYQPPVPLPTGKPGALIWAETIPAPAGARAWRVLSHTKSFAGQDTALSGIVVAPIAPAPRRGRPIVAWAHGTTGLADPCAPSKASDAAFRIPFVVEMLAAGYVVAATDYQGLGTPGVHPYLVGESEGRAVLDTARVARQLVAGASNRVLIAGHSQGGHAALFASEIAPKYAPDLKVLGTAAGAPVTDVRQFLDLAALSQSTAGFLVMGAQGYSVAYPDLARAPLFTEAAASRAAIALDRCAFEVILAFAGDEPGSVFTTDPNQLDMWRDKLFENFSGQPTIRRPILVWQGNTDILTPSTLVAPFVRKACEQKSVVEYREYPGADHGSVLDAAKSDVLAFFAARLAGEPPKSSCP